MRASASSSRSPVPDLDLLTVGRVNLDLYAQQVGVQFVDVTGWDAMVGGSPTNTALAAARLGVRSGLLSAVGDDLVGEWVLRALRDAGVETRHVVRKHGPHTSLALRAQVPPEHPLVFYRQDPADIHVTALDVASAPVEHARVVLVSADALARGSMAIASISVLRRARTSRKAAVYLDLDLREVNWPDLGAYASTVRTILDDLDVILGTEHEFAALLGVDADATGEIEGEVRELVLERPGLVAILKRGAQGVTLLCDSQTIHLPAHAVREASTVGAGDSFAAGLIAARIDGAGWQQAALFASACAAITVSRPGCSGGFPSREEVQELLGEQAMAGSLG
jgi:5-dehydro-2-deoxygluconokinase